MHMTRLVPALLLPLLLGGCVATKGDMRTLRDEMTAARAQQDAELRNLQRQNRMLLDSISAAMRISVNTQGTTAQRLRQFDETVAKLNEVMTQVMSGLTRVEQRFTDLDRRLDALERRSGTQSAAPGGDPEDLFARGMEQFQREGWATARLAFEQVVTDFPQHERAPAAQYRIGETYYGEKQYDQAYTAFEAVAQRWPDSPRARAALLQAGIIAQEQRNNTKARAYYRTVIQTYPNTDEAREAQRRLNQIR